MPQPLQPPQQHPQQAPQQQQQAPPQQGGAIMPQQLASIAEVLGPLLQQQGIMPGANINLGQLQQGLGAGLAQQGLMQVTKGLLCGVSCLYCPFF